MEKIVKFLVKQIWKAFYYKKLDLAKIAQNVI